MSVHHDQLVALAAYLAGQRDAIMDAWRNKVAADPKLTTGNTLPKAQLNDHLPALLEDLEKRLTRTDAVTSPAAVEGEQGDAAAHGLHRWQQGFDLAELSRELGRFNECVVAALDECASVSPQLSQAAMAEARSIWAALYSVALGSSTAAYFKLQQLEAAGHVADLEQALETSRQLEVHSAALWRQAAHDLRGNLGVVTMVTAGLTSAHAPVEAREKFLGKLDRNVRALHRLLEDVTSLARLQGGQESRTLAEMDASGLLHEIAESVQHAATERGLLLGFDGPDAFVVEGDAVKIRRIVQNLAINAIKYTPDGAVNVSWGPQGEGDDTDRWFIKVTDTGPGLHAVNGVPLASALHAATQLAGDVEAGGSSGELPRLESGQLSTPPAATAARATRGFPHEGEGIGLSIVKRLCTLLDATLEVESSAGQGTTFRIVLPRHYAQTMSGAVQTPAAPGTADAA